MLHVPRYQVPKHGRIPGTATRTAGRSIAGVRVTSVLPVCVPLIPLPYKDVKPKRTSTAAPLVAAGLVAMGVNATNELLTGTADQVPPHQGAGLIALRREVWRRSQRIYCPHVRGEDDGQEDSSRCSGGLHLARSPCVRAPER